MLGIGSTPLGSSPVGGGMPATLPAPTGQVFQDPTTGASLDGRLIINGRYVFSANGRAQGMTAAQQYVTLAFTTRRGSTGDPTIGERISAIRDILPNFSQQALAFAAEALDAGIKAKLVSLRGVDVFDQPNPNAKYIRIRWTDLTTGIDQATFV